MEMPAESPLDEQTPTTPRMWQLWRPFAGIHGWFFAPGTPPPLRNLSGREAVVQISVLCAAMGLLAGMCTLGVSLVLSFLPRQFRLLWFPLTGFIYGVLIVYPLSRWLGQGFLRSAGGVVLCVFVWCSQFALYSVSPSLLHAWFGGGLVYYTYYASSRILRLTVAFSIPVAILGVYIGGSKQQKTWMLSIILPLTFGLAVGQELLRLSGPYWPRVTVGTVSYQIVRELLTVLPLIWYEVFLAVTLGMLLWPVARETDVPIDHSAESV